MRIFRTIFSGEFIFALYILAGSFKAAINFPIDITLFLFLVTFFIAIKKIFINNKSNFPKRNVIPLIMFFLIILFALSSIWYTPTNTDAVEKLILFGIVAGWCFVGPFFLFEDKNSLIRFLYGILTLSTIMAFSLIFQGLNDGLEFEASVSSSYTFLARISAMGTLILIIKYFYEDSSKIKSLIILILSVLLLIPLIQAGSRMPFLSLGIVFLMFPISMIIFKKNNVNIWNNMFRFIIAFALLIVSILYLIKEGYAKVLSYRIEVMLFSNQGGESILGRLTRIDTAWDMAIDSYFMGFGLDSFSVYYPSAVRMDYPHNIYLELLSELGFIPLVLFILLIIFAFRGLFIDYKKYGVNSINMTIFSIMLFWIINSIGSSSLIGDKPLYAFMAIAIVLPTLNNFDYKEINNKI